MRQGILRMENSFLFQFFLISILILCMSNTTNAKNLVYENNWAYLADTVMGGVSRGNAEFIPGALRLKARFQRKTTVDLSK